MDRQIGQKSGCCRKVATSVGSIVLSVFLLSIPSPLNTAHLYSEM